MANLLRKQVTVRCGPEAAFTTFCEKIDLWWPPGHRKFDGSTLRLEPVAGGRFFESHPEKGEFVLGVVSEVTPPFSLRFSWNPGKLTQPTDVSVRFLAEGSNTRVDIEHREGSAAMGEQWPERAAVFDAGWSRVLSGLENHILHLTRS